MTSRIERSLIALSRRRLLTAALALSAAAAPRWAEALPGAIDGASVGLKPGDADQSRALARALERSARERRPLALPPGLYRAARIDMPDGAVLVGVPEATRLVLTEGGPLISASGGARIALRGVVLDGGNVPRKFSEGVLEAVGVQALALDEVSVVNAGGTGIVMTRSGGHVRNSRIEGARYAALFSLDGRGVTVTDCVIRGCRNNGVVIRRSHKGDDGSVVARNRIEDTGALDGGLGWNGNAVNVSKAGGVIVSGNAIRRSAFTAVRAHEADDVVITDNLCLDGGETGLYVEFGFSGAVVSGNLVDGAASGVSVANFNEGGRLGAVTGNVLRNLFRRKKLDAEGEGYGFGIAVEADVTVTGNVVENAASFGVHAGWGPYLRDVTISGNVVRGCEVGVGVSVVEGVGPATIVGNTITGSRRGSILGYRWADAVTPDLATGGGSSFPGLTIAQNTIR